MIIIKRPSVVLRSLTAATAVLVMSALGVGTADAAVTAPSAGTATAHANSLAVTALKVAPGSVKPGLGQAAVAVTWTITDKDTAATTVHGNLYIRLQGDKPGTYIGMAYAIPFTLPDPCGGECGVTSSGTAAKSSYRVVYSIPVYAATKKAVWVVDEIDASDDQGNTLTAQDAALQKFSRSVTSVSQVDSTPPLAPSVALDTASGAASDLYDGDGPVVEHYLVDPVDWQSGFWKGSLTLAGPGGQTLTSDFDYPVTDPQGGACQSTGGGVSDNPTCSVAITFPAGSVGTWTVASVSATDNAGNTADYPLTGVLPVTLSDDSGFSASGFALTPNPVNAWWQSQTTQLTFSAAGVRQGLTSVTVNVGYGCDQPSTTPTQNADGTYSVALVMESYLQQARCPVTGILMVDGAGDAALYGPDFHAPDPGLAILNAPDVAPTVTAASLSPDTLPASQTGQTNVQVHLTVSVPVSPLANFQGWFYNSAGQAVGSTVGGVYTPAAETNAVTLMGWLPWNTPAGTYTFGFTLTDYAGTTVAYGGPSGLPLPGGPLTITVTP